MLKITSPIVSAKWLHQNIDAENLIILDATISKVTSKNATENTNTLKIEKAIFFDLKTVFSQQNAPYPNTILSAAAFEKAAQAIGINTNSCIVVYDNLGVYSSPRVWWMFTLMGFTNIAVLDGGLPEWKKNGFPLEEMLPTKKTIKKGNFKVTYHQNKIKTTQQVLSAINDEQIVIVDARSAGRFNASEPEPRKDIRSGHIPNSINLPYQNLQINGQMKSIKELKEIVKKINPDKKEMIFSCGSGITACILALGTSLAGYTNYAVYDGSWTEWGSRKELPIEK
ncbi:sulfurtransferase [Tenacibaculum sp. UWU-22]|uniref:sulfurtransferase n=1 Tax=Tenacibaculum sp. UWU-22 TaxID=3234187 RepID=UPI0034DB599F